MSAAFKKILVPIDFSEQSLLALNYADLLAKEFKAQMILVHVVERSPYEMYAAEGFLPNVPIYPTVNNRVLDQDYILEETKKQLDQLAAAGRGGPCVTESRFGYPVEEVLAAAKLHRADLLVICTHGRTGLSHLVMGSVAEKLVRLAPIPVLSIRVGALND
jgi:nucleotide-binding universal stress UspA family protein